MEDAVSRMEERGSLTRRRREQENRIEGKKKRIHVRKRTKEYPRSWAESKGDKRRRVSSLHPKSREPREQCLSVASDKCT